MWISLVAIFLLMIPVTYARILLYNTEDEEAVEKFDCVYYVPTYGEEISYCRRTGRTESLNRQRNECDNQGEKKLLRDLIGQQIDPHIILQWSSSVEIADLYADHSVIDEFVCNCTREGTFGKYCEYQLTHDAKTFSEAIEAQFKEKKAGDSWNTQRYGKVLCYETLSCPGSPLCLDWREICDGIQRCENGIDEENCDKLEFNECEDHEFRCTNGMCIAEEFWLDGDFDCMDWSDEYLINHGKECPFEANAIECDEHLCRQGMYSCGEGECITWATRMPFQRLVKADEDCFNKRNLNYMCEMSPHRSAWTLESGLCWPEQDYDDSRYPPWNLMNASKLSDEEKCSYLFRCVWSKGLERDCPCNGQNCKQMMMNVCPRSDHTILYPSPGLISSNIGIMHSYSQSLENPTFIFRFFGGLKCRGYLLQINVNGTIFNVDPRAFIFISLMNHLPCLDDDPNVGDRDELSPYQVDRLCWNGSLTFNGRPYAVKPDTCTNKGECISQYRIQDGLTNCVLLEDEYENFKENYCTGNVARHRFQCFTDEHKCLSLIALGTGITQCSNSYDESWFGTGTGTGLHVQLKCLKGLTNDCHLVKAYIQQSDNRNSTNESSLINSHPQESTNVMSFRRYCDTFWDLENHVDENPSSCQNWICQENQYQCRTGQCIPLNWVCDGEWDCSDASDEEAIVLIANWSTHNVELSNLLSRVAECHKRYAEAPFSSICNRSFEFGCYRSNVPNPLNITSNRPCINLTQIGDGIEDCHNAYDEKNTFTAANSLIGGMWAFHFHCGNEHEIYTTACHDQLQCPQILCSRYRDQNGSCSNTNDFICLDDNRCEKNARCDGKVDCSNGEDEYWCKSGTMNDRVRYRHKKKISIAEVAESPVYLQYPLQPQSNANTYKRSFQWNVQSYECNRGIAVVEMNETRCLCPPAYYGDRCEFFSDRISVIVHVDTRPWNLTLKVKANLLFKNGIIDHHEFHVIPELEKDKMVKHKFYFVYSRSSELVSLKRWRYLNRSDVIMNHPYSVHFDAFSLEKNDKVEEIGSWHYPIYYDYLPVFRLSVVLKFPTWFGNVTLGPCNANSSCFPIFNVKNSSYCSCKSGYYGVNCSMYEPICQNYCSNNALCQSEGKEKKNPSCICPLGYFGARCNLKFGECNPNPCLNNRSCRPSYDRSGEMGYSCICSERFYGKKCEHEHQFIHINWNMAQTLSARATVIQLYTFHAYNFLLLIKHQQVSRGLPSSFKYSHSNVYLPEIGVLKIYEEFSTPKHFLIYVLWNQVNINFTLSPTPCPHASSLLPRGQFFQQPEYSVAAVFLYHHICRNNTQLICFHDESYLCICQNNHYRAECFINEIEHDRCSKCLSGGRCVKGDLKDPNDFICLCRSCHQGHRCEFSMEAFGVTLDSLLVNYSKELKMIYVSIVCLLFIIAFLNNICSFVTFKRRAPRMFGVGNYLLIVACLNQITLVCLLFKLIEISIGSFNIGSCKTISYFLSVMTRSTYWLISWISVDRLLTIFFPMSSSLKSPRRAIGISIVTLIILFGMHVHEIISYTVIQHHSTGLSICVTNFDTKLLSTYNRISTLIHYLFPFFIQIICITLLIVLAAHNRAKVSGHQITFGEVLKKQFKSQKELYITPTIVILSALPQTIITFSFACTQLNDWQSHALLVSYLLSYTPQVLGFILYVLPSTTYKKEFCETFIGKNTLRWKT